MNNQKPKRSPLKLIFILGSLAIIIWAITSLFKSDKIGKYTKEDLPPNFAYKTITDDSNNNLEKNQLEIEINQKLTEGQIATLAEELFKSKYKQRRFYNYYDLNDGKNKVASWATSHFDPELEITINGSTTKQGNQMLEEAKKVDGKIIGIFDEPEATANYYAIYEKDGKKFLKTSFKNGQSMVEELVESKHKNGLKLVAKDEGHGEYLVLTKSNVLNFYNKEDFVFATGLKVE